ncbi:MAG: hypothetical protein KJZ91_01580 [Myxococcales bacterium]|nr:hypothetical protein [Myxococcales bacterium]
MKPSRPARALTLRDRLSRLDFAAACKLAGPGGAALLRDGGALELELDGHVLTDERFAIRVPGPGPGRGATEVAITLDDARPGRLRANCSRCRAACVHVGAALSLVLEEKVALGLAALPPEAGRGRRRHHAVDRLRGDQRAVGQVLPGGAAQRRAR